LYTGRNARKNRGLTQYVHIRKWVQYGVMRVYTWVNSGNDDMRKQETARGGYQRDIGSSIRDTAVQMENRTLTHTVATLNSTELYLHVFRLN